MCASAFLPRDAALPGRAALPAKAGPRQMCASAFLPRDAAPSAAYTASRRAPCRMQLSLLAARAGGLLVCSAPAAVAVCALLCRLPAALVAVARGGSAAYEGAAAPTLARHKASLLASLLAGACAGEPRAKLAGRAAHRKEEAGGSGARSGKRSEGRAPGAASLQPLPSAGPNLRLAVRKIAAPALGGELQARRALSGERTQPAGERTQPAGAASSGQLQAPRAFSLRPVIEGLAVRIAGRTSGPAQARCSALSLSFAFHRVSDLSSLSSLASLGLASLSLSLFS